jgi:hypothetical protein
MELSSEVEDVIFRETCRRQAIKATQGLDLRLLDVYGYGTVQLYVCGVRVECVVIVERQISWQNRKRKRKRIPGVELRHLHRHLRVARLRSSAAMAARALGLGQLRSSAVVR